MSDYTTYDQVIDSINELRDRIEQKAKKQFLVSYTIIFISVIILSFVLYATGLDWYIPLSIIGSTIFLMVVLYVIAAYTRNNKLKNEHLNKEVIKLYNSMHETNYDYDAHPTIDKTFNQEMGLFTRHASIKSNFIITADPETSTNYTINHCQMTTSNGKTTTVHFSGYYARIPTSNIDRQQIRSKGKAHLKGIKMIRLEDYEDCIYVPDDQSVLHPDATLYSIFQRIQREFDVSSCYVASDMKEVAIAISLKETLKLPKELDYNTLQEYTKPLYSILEFIEEATQQIQGGEYE